MSRAQTTPQLQNAITFGSCKVEYRTYGSTGAFTDLGLGTGISVEETVETAELTPDNGSPLALDLKEHSCTFKMNMWELDFAKIYALRGGASGLDTYGTVAASSATATNEEHVLSGVTGVRLNYRNGDGSIVTITAATDAAGTTAVLGTDYVKYVDGNGFTCVARVAASTVLTDGDTIKVTYSYTPLASKTWSTGGKSTIGYIELKLTNVKSINGSDKSKVITIHKAQIQSGLNLEFPAGDSSDPVEYPLEFKAYDDATRTAGDQLFSVSDEQGV
jgi:hypothetical protein